jgi:hypothetical protein
MEIEEIKKLEKEVEELHNKAHGVLKEQRNSGVLINIDSDLIHTINNMISVLRGIEKQFLDDPKNENNISYYYLSEFKKIIYNIFKYRRALLMQLAEEVAENRETKVPKSKMFDFEYEFMQQVSRLISSQEGVISLIGFKKKTNK